MRARMTRDFYIPSEYSEKVESKKAPAEAYLYEHGDLCFAMGFGGKRSKPDFHFRFNSAEKGAEYVKDYIERQESHAEIRLKERAKRNAFKHTLEVGSILYSSWGYDQTNIDFYQVTEVVGAKSVKIRAIGSARTDESNPPCDYVVAVKDAFLDNEKEMLKRVGQDNVITIASYARAYPWDGQPKYETSLGWGH